MDLNTFLGHLNELNCEGSWRLGGICWVGNRELRLTVALEKYDFVDTPMVSAVSMECHGVTDASLRLASHPHDCGEFWITDRHPILDYFGPWARLVSEQPVEQPDRLFAAISRVVASHYGGDLSRISEITSGLDWRDEGIPHFEQTQIASGAEPLIRELLPVVREHCANVELELQPEATTHDLVRPTWLVGFSENWVACERTTVVRANGELGSMLNLAGAALEVATH